MMNDPLFWFILVYGIGVYATLAYWLFCAVRWACRNAARSLGVLALLLLLPSSLEAADRFAKTAGGAWSASSTWSATASAGVDNAGAPTAADNVIFDATSGNVTIDAAAVARSVDFDGAGPGIGSYMGTLTHNAGITLSIGDATAGTGNIALRMVAGMTYTLGSATTSAISFVSTSATQQTITTAGKILGNTTINGAGSSYQIADAFTGSGSWTRTTGTIALNTQTLTLSGAAATFAGGGVTYAGTVVLSGSGAATMTGANTFTTLTRTGTAVKTDSLIISGANQVVTGTFTVTGNSVVNRVLVSSATVGTAQTITAAAVALTNVDFMDITAAGAASPFTGTSLGNALGNSGITFGAPTTQTHDGTTSNWSTAARWTSRVPLPQDTVIISSGTGTVTNDMPRNGADMTFTGFTGTLTDASISHTSYGSLTLASGMTFTHAAAWIFAGRSTHTITSATKTFNTVTWNAPLGTYTLQDALVSNGANSPFTVAFGTLATNNVAVTSGSFAVNTGATLNAGNSTFTETTIATAAIWTASTAATVSASSATIVLSTASANARIFAGGGKTYGTLTYTVNGSTGALTVTGSNTIGTVNFSDVTNARTLQFTSGTAQTITGTFNVVGTSGKLMTVKAITAASPFTLIRNQGPTVLDYLSIQDVAVQGAWYPGANSVNVSGNTGFRWFPKKWHGFQMSVHAGGGPWPPVHVFRLSSTSFEVRTPVPSGTGNEFSVWTMTDAGGWHLTGVSVLQNGVTATTLGDSVSTYEYAFKINTTDAPSTPDWPFYGFGHGLQARTFVSVRLDGVDVATLPLSTAVYGTVLLVQQELDVVHNAIVAGHVSLTHRWDADQMTVLHSHTHIAGYQIYSAYAAMLPLTEGAANRTQVGANAAHTVLGDNGAYDLNTPAAGAKAWHTTAHVWEIQLNLPSGGPNDSGSWALAPGPEQFWVHDRAIPYGPKFYANHIGTLYGQRVTAGSSSHTANYKVVRH